jgi:dihydrodipicolinate synthase/N-acetylneuraminate lyase
MSRNFIRFMGMMPILPTTIDENGDIISDDIKALVEYCIKAGSKAIGHLAGASEFNSIAREDRELIIKTLVRDVNGRLPVFMGAAANNVKDSVYNAKTAEALGADLIMLCSPPMGSGTVDELFKYYERVCSAVNIPVIVQDTGGSAANYSPAFLIRLYNEIENIGYVKAEGGQWLQKLHELMQIIPDGLQVIGGAAGKNMMQMLHLGVTAFMTGTEAQEIHNSVVQAYLSGDEDKALHLYCTTLLPYLELFTSTNSRISLKHMLSRRGILSSERILFPANDISPANEFVLRELDWLLDRIDKGNV